MATACLAGVAVIHAGRELGWTCLAVFGDEHLYANAMSALALYCHQIPSRCYWIAGAPLPCCARCVGIYAGLMIGPAIFYYGRSLKRMVHRVIIAAVVATGDITAKTVGLDAPAPCRTIAGVAAGAMILCMLLAAAHWLWRVFTSDDEPAELAYDGGMRQ